MRQTLARCAGTMLGIGLSAFIGSSPAAFAADATLKLHHHLPVQSMPSQDVIIPWAEKVQADSDGRIEVQIYPKMQLGGKPPQIVEQVAKGVVEVGWTLPGYTPGRFPHLEVFELPTVFSEDLMATNFAMLDLWDSHVSKDFKDIKPAMLTVHAGNIMHCRDTPIRAVADFEGLKIRTPSRTGGFMLEALGATPIGMPVTSVPEALSKGVIDCAAIPWVIVAPMKVHELVKYHTLLPGDGRFGSAVLMLILNERKIDALPADLNSVVEDLSGPFMADLAANAFRDGEASGEAAARARGNEIIEFSEQEAARFRELVAPALDRWVAEVGERGIDGRALITEARNAIAARSSR